MSIFGKRSLGGTPISQQSDDEIRRKVNGRMKFGESIATRAQYAMEAEKRGIAWRQTDRMAEKNKK